MSFSREYSDIYEKTGSIPQFVDRKRLNRFLSLIPKGSYAILDAGCAEGELALELARRGNHVVACDISESFLGQFQGIEKMHADIEIDPLGHEKFDYIFLTDVLEHLRSPVKALENLRIALKDEGSLILNTPNAQWWFNILYNWYCRNRILSFDSADITQLHTCTFYQLTLRNLLWFSGFRVVKTHNSVLSHSLLFECRKAVKPFDIDSWVKAHQ